MQMVIDTPRTRLRPWQESDRQVFAAMSADPDVMLSWGAPMSRMVSDARLDRYMAAFKRHGFCRWLLETRDGEFIGYAGIMPGREGHPLGPHFEIGWGLVRRAWGRGYATEAAKAALQDVFTRGGLTEVLGYTTPENVR